MWVTLRTPDAPGSHRRVLRGMAADGPIMS